MQRFWDFKDLMTKQFIDHVPCSLLNCSLYICPMNLKELYKKYFPYFVDVWQYLAIIVIFIVAAIFFL